MYNVHITYMHGFKHEPTSYVLHSHSQVGQSHAPSEVSLHMVAGAETHDGSDLLHGIVNLGLQVPQTVFPLRQAWLCGHHLDEGAGHRPLHVGLHGRPALFDWI